MEHNESVKAWKMAVSDLWTMGHTVWEEAAESELGPIEGLSRRCLDLGESFHVGHFCFSSRYLCFCYSLWLLILLLRVLYWWRFLKSESLVMKENKVVEIKYTCLIYLEMLWIGE